MYEVFISFKNLDKSGKPTRDAQLAREVFDELTARGFRVFFSSVSLEQLGISGYKAAIDKALDSSRILVAVGTSAQHLDAQWVRYEWDGFFNDILSGIKPDGRVFVFVEGCEPRSLPRALRQSQVFDRDEGGIEKLANFIANALSSSSDRRSDDDDLTIASKVKTRQSFEPEMVLIQAGTFTIGSPESEIRRESNEHQHSLTIAKPFELGRYSVTFVEYDAFCVATQRKKPSDQGWGRDRRPVIHVSWNDAVAYCQWLFGQTGNTYRLPTEAEWEYACRAGTTGPFSFESPVTTAKANYDGNHQYNSSPKGEHRQMTLPVGSFPPNHWGLYDMHGNVWEWTCSAYDEKYGRAEQQCNGDDSILCVVRGGAWSFGPKYMRSAFRNAYTTDRLNDFLGFRVAMTLTP